MNYEVKGLWVKDNVTPLERRFQKGVACLFQIRIRL